MTNEHILVVDDEESICRLCSLELKQLGFAADWTTRASEGLEKIKNEPFDLLITDIKMPEFSGIELMKLAHQVRPDIPVIIMTAYASFEIVLQALKQGASNFINKPFHRDEFKFTIQSVLEKQRLFKENMRLKSLINLINVSDQINTVHEPTKIYSLLMDAAIRETGATRGKVYHLDESNQKFVLEWESDPDQVYRKIENQAKNVFQWPGKEQFSVGTNPAKNSSEKLPESVSIPLHTHNKLKGLLSLFNDKGQKFSPSDFDIAKILASQAAIALENNELLRQIEKLFLETIKSLASTLDEKDPYTHGHSQRVSEIAVEIGKRMGFDAEALEILALAGSLHDIGKIGIPDQVLQKPGKLSWEEFEIIKTHPEKGARILSHIQRLEPVVDAVYSHHEWYNGTGYPRGLKGKEIPISGAIISIADALDTITSDRPYRKRRSFEEAYSIVKEVSGVQFYPEVATAVLTSPLKSLSQFVANKNLP